jgi:hypothetical protein
MATTMRGFAKTMRDLSKQIPVRAGQIVADIGYRVLTTVVVGTPVKTGYARSQWLVGVGAEPQGASGILAAGAVIARGRSVLKNPPPDADVNIVNNASYIGDLNAGTSRQAPVGFVEIAVIQAVRGLRDAVLFEEPTD